MSKSEAWLAGADAGRKAMKDGSVFHAITPPEDYDDQQKSDFTSGWLLGAKAQRDADLVDEISKSA